MHTNQTVSFQHARPPPAVVTLIRRAFSRRAFSVRHHFHNPPLIMACRFIPPDLSIIPHLRVVSRPRCSAQGKQTVSMTGLSLAA